MLESSFNTLWYEKKLHSSIMERYVVSGTITDIRSTSSRIDMALKSADDCLEGGLQHPRRIWIFRIEWIDRRCSKILLSIWQPSSSSVSNSGQTGSVRELDVNEVWTKTNRFTSIKSQLERHSDRSCERPFESVSNQDTASHESTRSLTTIERAKNDCSSSMNAGSECTLTLVSSPCVPGAMSGRKPKQ